MIKVGQLMKKEETMRQLLTIGFLVMILGVDSGAPCLAAEDDGSKIAIIAPKSGETVGRDLCSEI
jgi:hypothetical protein